MLIHAYNEKWIADFIELRKYIAKALAGLDIFIEHIGSTAIPGLAAKPIIDIDVVFTNNTSFDEIKRRLESIGYYHNGNQGIPGREVFRDH